MYNAVYQDLSPGFRGDFGYIPRVDYRRAGIGVNRLFWGKPGDWFTRWMFGAGAEWAYDYDGNLTGWSHDGYMPRIRTTYGKDPKQMPFDFTELVGALAPRAFFINAPAKDGNFEVSGVKDCVRAALPVYELYGARDKLVAVHPDCGHDFPPAVREAAYTFVDKALRR